MKTAQAFIALGSNLGDRLAMMESALDLLSADSGIRIMQRSGIYETQAVSSIQQPPFLNAAAELETGLSARELLQRLLRVEEDLGRIRKEDERWGPRTIDLDLLYYDGQIIEEPGLRVPHPRLAERHFVLFPLAQIASALRIPPVGRTVGHLLAALPPASGIVEYPSRGKCLH